MAQTTSSNGDRAAMLANLRLQVRAMEGFKPDKADNFAKFGIPEIDAAFPDGGLPLAAAHEFVAANNEDAAATVSFIAALISRIHKNHGTIVWVERETMLYPPGLAEYGIDASKIIFMHPRNERDAMAVIEEALRTSGISAVVGDIGKADLNATRRFQMAAQESGTVGLLMRLGKQPASTLSACTTRWKICYGLSEDSQGLPGLGETRWNIVLDKVRHGQAKAWEVDWLNKEFSLARPKQVIHSVPQPKYNDNVKVLFR